MRNLLQSVSAMLRVWADRVLREPEDAEIAFEQHSAVYAAIRSRDVEAAGNAMDSHMVTAGDRLLRVIRI